MKPRLPAETRAYILAEGQKVTYKRFGFYRWLLALLSLDKDQSEFDRRVVSVEDVTPVQRPVRRGVGSY